MLLLALRILLQLQNHMISKKKLAPETQLQECERDEGFFFKEEATRVEINKHQSMQGLYFQQVEKGQFLKDRQATQSR